MKSHLSKWKTCKTGWTLRSNFNAAPKRRLWFSTWAATFDVQRLPWQMHLKSMHQSFQGARLLNKALNECTIARTAPPWVNDYEINAKSTGPLGCFYMRKLFQLSCRTRVVKSEGEPYLVFHILSISHFFSNGDLVQSFTKASCNHWNSFQQY